MLYLTHWNQEIYYDTNNLMRKRALNMVNPIEMTLSRALKDSFSF